jgi:hypothetical protein
VVDAHSGAPERTLSKQVFGMSRSELSDDGSYFWQASSNGAIHVSGPRGDAVVQTSGEFLGLDLTGRALIFRRPPLLRPHREGQFMPLTVGLLADYQCSLLQILDPYAKTGK